MAVFSWITVAAIVTYHASGETQLTRYKRQPLGGYCPSGGQPYINPRNGIAQGCPAGGGCPGGYVCAVSTTRQRLCCGGGLTRGLILIPLVGYRRGNVIATCPAGFQPQFVNSQPRLCTLAGQIGACPAPFVCTQSSSATVFMCCRPVSSGNPCNGIGQPLRVGGAIRYCNNIGQSCTAAGYTCQSSPNSGNGLGVCCGTGGATPRCSNGGLPYMLGVNPFRCTPGTDNCPDNYVCENGIGQGVCCRGTNSRCPGGGAPDSRDCEIGGTDCDTGLYCANLRGGTGCCNEPVCPDNGEFYAGARCSRRNRNTCGGNRRCVETTPGVYSCCSSGEQLPGECPSGMDQDSTRCTLNGNECPTDYTCTSTTNGVPACCGSGTPGDCPNNQRLEAEQGACTDDQDCGDTFVCKETNNRVRGCCSRGDPNKCANGGLPQIVGRQAKRCTGGGGCRPGYFCEDSEDGSARICCQGPRCARGVTIAGTPNGSPKECSIGGSDCPRFADCQTSVNFPDKQICCQTRFLSEKQKTYLRELEADLARNNVKKS